MMKPFPVITTRRLVLRNLTDADAAQVFELYANPLVTRSGEMSTLTNVCQAGKVIKVFQADWELDSGVRWAICGQDSRRLIGICGVGWHRPNHSALLSYDLTQAFWNRGIMTEAARAVVDFTFSQPGVNRITATTILDNPASSRVLRHLGFHEEGILRQWAFWKGEFKDLRCFSLLRGEYLTASRTTPVFASAGSVREQELEVSQR
jgi:ribosomal-protein-alanine N-acetyltransferase